MLTRPGPRRIKRRYGIPFEGFTSSVPAHMCPPSKVWGAGAGSATTSINMAFDPVDGKFYRRPGTATVGGTSGLLESVSGSEAFKARKLIALESPSLTDGRPTHAVLFTDETLNLAQLYVRNTNSGVTLANYSLGEEFSASHYPGAAAGTMNIKCVPYYRTTDGAFGRLATADTRAYALAGSRGAQESGEWVYFPNINSVPMKWNRRLNGETASGSENLRLMPTGAIPPIGLPRIAYGATVSGGVWKSGDFFAYSVAFQYADGSVSLPMIPRNPTAANEGGYCRSFHSTATTVTGLLALFNDHDAIVWRQIPVGPEGVVGRWLLRTPKLNSNTTPISTVISPLDLQVAGYIGNNLPNQFYVDTNANDLSLSARPDIIRFDRILPPAARYISNFDGRLICGYTKPNPTAIFLAPMSESGALNDGSPSLSQLNDDSASLVAQTWEYDVGVTTADQLTIKHNGVSKFNMVVDSTKTIQDVVDTINGWVISGGGSLTGSSLFAACVAPGADANATADNLQRTTSCNTGDTSGAQRAFGSAYPGALYFSTTYLAQFPTEKRRWFFTQGGPGVQSNLADSWLAGNYRTGLASWGNLQGFAPLLDGCLIFFTKAVILFRNIKSGKSGLDDDYHPDDLFTNVGCIAWDSIAYGDGWAGCLTDRGYCVFDGTRGGIKNISLDVYNPDTGAGEWAYEIAKCQASCGKDDDDQHFHAKVMGGTLYVTYRSSEANTERGRPDRMLEYSFSGSSASTGLDQVLRPDGKPWGWSTPHNVNISVMGEVRKSTGIARYGVQEYAALPEPLAERIVQFETGQRDAGPNGITGELYLPIDFAESLRKKQAEEISVLHKGNGGNGQLLTVVVVQGGSGYAVDNELTVSGGNTNGTVKVTAVGAGGAVTAITVWDGGTGYAAQAQNLSSPVTGGAGTGCTVRVSHVASALVLSYYLTNGVVTSQVANSLILPPTGTGGTFLRTVVPLPLVARTPAIGSQIRFIDYGQSDDTDGEQSAIWGCELDLVDLASYD